MIVAMQRGGNSSQTPLAEPESGPPDAAQCWSCLGAEKKKVGTGGEPRAERENEREREGGCGG